NGQLPNNWYSTFGGPAWEYDPHTDQYYYHFFVKGQPDLNWHNPEVKQAMWEVVRFWLDLGVDGFRLDAIATIFEDPNYPDHTSPLSQAELFHNINQASEPLSIQQARQLGQRMFDSQVEQPGVHMLMQEFRSIIDEYDDKVLIGENDNVAYHGDGENELHMVFNFPLMRTNELTPEWVRQNQEIRLASLASISKDA
ncbi:MAG: alpha-glucosidase, partial [Anaerolineales bacterium]|nr:alpha-glucosidase [Anaerolineales bacterium]